MGICFGTNNALGWGPQPPKKYKKTSTPTSEKNSFVNDPKIDRRSYTSTTRWSDDE